MSDFKAFLISTTPMQRLLAACILVLVYAACMYQFVYAAKLKQLEKDRSEYARMQQSVSQRGSDIRELKLITAGAHQIAPDNREALNLADNSLFTRSTIKEFLDTTLPTLAAEAGIQDLVVNEDITSAEDALVRTNQSDAIIVRRIPVEISFASDFGTLTEFSTRLWADDHFLDIKSLDTKSRDPMDNDLSVSMTIYCYFEEGID